PRREPPALERPERDPEVVRPRAFLERDPVRKRVQRGDRYGRELRETARDGEPHVRVAGLALPVVQAERVHPFTAAHTDAAPGAADPRRSIVVTVVDGPGTGRRTRAGRAAAGPSSAPPRRGRT